MKFTVTDSGCWEWTGALTSNGYARISYGRSTLRIHRAMYELLVERIPPEFDVDHLCHNADKKCPGGPTCRHRRCINPAHLEAVVRAVNLSRGRRPALKTHCINGHEYDEANTRLSETKGRQCRACDREWSTRKRKRRQEIAS